MKTSRLIYASLLATATLAAFPSCKDDSSAPEQAVVAQSATEQAAPNRSLEKRAAVFSALALLPANISDFTAVADIGGNMLRLAESGVLPEFTREDLDEKLLALDSAALAATAANPATYALMVKVLKNVTACSLTTLSELHGGLDTEAGEAFRESVRTEALKAMGITRGADGLMGDADWKNARIPASYAVITAKPGKEAVLDELYSKLLADLQECDKEGESPVNDVNGFSGIRIDLSKAPATGDTDEELQAFIRSQLVGRNAYVLARRQGNALILALCEDPQDIRLATSPADSVLATDLLNPCDANLSKGMIAAVHISKELEEVSRANGIDSILALAPTISKAFASLSEQDAANAATFTKAARGMEFLGKQLGQISRPGAHPMDMQLWCDEGLHCVATADAQGGRYLPGKLRHAAVGNAPSTIFYAESTPSEMDITIAPAEEWLDALQAVAEGFALTLPAEGQREILPTVAMAQMFRPEALALCKALSTINDGLKGDGAIIVDSTPAALPSFFNSTSSATAEMPRLSLYYGVSDRSKLAQGWDAILDTAGQLATKLGSDPTIINMLPIVPTPVGKAMSYKIALPFFTPDFVPNLVVSDEALAIGTSDKLNARLVESATGNSDFAGCVFSFKPAALSKCLMSLAQATQSRQGEPSDLLVPAAASKMAADVVEEIRGTSTIENGVHTFRIDVKFSK